MGVADYNLQSTALNVLKQFCLLLGQIGVPYWAELVSQHFGNKIHLLT